MRWVSQAFRASFPDATLWEGGGLNWLLMGTRERSDAVRTEAFTRQWAQPGVEREMARLGLELPEQLGATFLADASQLAMWCDEAPPLRDMHPGLLSSDVRERSPHAAWYRSVADACSARKRFASSDWIRSTWPAELRQKTLPWFEYQGMLNYAFYPEYRPDDRQVADDLRAVLSQTRLTSLPLFLLGASPEEVAIAERQAETTAVAGSRHHLVLAAGAMSAREFTRARALLEACLSANPSQPTRQLALLALAALNG